MQTRPPRAMSTTPTRALLLGLALLQAASPATVLAQTLPYTPTQVLASACFNESACDGAGLAYVLDGDKFLAINYTAQVTDGQEPEELEGQPGMPFGAPYSAARANDGRLMAYAGECGVQGKLWTYTTGDGWQEEQIQSGSDVAGGPHYLGAAMAFSTKLAPVMDKPSFYVYGGMCPSSSSETVDSWQLSANYTKSMLRIAPDGDKEVAANTALMGGPKAPMAGFTKTQLPHSLANVSGTITQQARWVLLGGHTSTAFINMSNAVLWGLPDESWTFINIQAPKVDGPTELSRISKRASTEVTPRSGHTAVLNEDGKSITVLGGWVGDVNTAADPQLAVLEMSQAYSGWRWKIPSKQPDFGAIYGHGAAVLPGNVMVVYGGRGIETSELRTKTKRQAAGLSSPRYLNLTDMTWATTYTNPATSSGSGNPDAPNGSTDSSTPMRLGLGLGLGLGLSLILIMSTILFCIWKTKQKKNRQSRDAAVAALVQDSKNFIHDGDDEMAERDDFFATWGRGGWFASGALDPYRQQGEQDRSLGYESLRGAQGSGSPQDYGAGYMMGVPSIIRKPVPRQQRSSYMSAQSAFINGPGGIHPILEDDEDEFHHAHAIKAADDIPQTPTSDVPSDPFISPINPVPAPLFSRPNSGAVSPESIRRYDTEVQDWVSEVDAAEGLLDRMNSGRGKGRVSPTRRASHRSMGGRDDESAVGSGLSEVSSRSATRRTNVAMAMAGLNVIENKPGSSSSSSYNTAKSSFNVLQNEGPSLLMGGTGPTDEELDARASAEDVQMPGSPSKSKPRRGWLGSLRRVFSTSGRSVTPSSTESREYAQSPHSWDQHSGDMEPPSRLVGLNGELLRRKQGRRDWEDSGEEDQWDIERAVEQRLVQVMFTVPKERLRVVNGDDENPVDEEMAQTAELVDPEKESLRRTVTAESDLVEQQVGAQRDNSSSIRRSYDGGVRMDNASSSHRRSYATEDGGVRMDNASSKRRSYATEDGGVKMDNASSKRRSYATEDGGVRMDNASSKRRSYATEDGGVNITTEKEPEKDMMLLRPPQSPDPDHDRRRSHSTMGGESAVVEMAEEVRMERPAQQTRVLQHSPDIIPEAAPSTPEKPRSRVLRMVESIESANTSPRSSPSPTRGERRDKS